MALQVDGQGLPQPLRIELIQPQSPKKTFLDRLKDVGVIGLAGAILATAFGTVFQYSRWIVEQRLERNAEDFKAASGTFDNLILDLAKAQTLQETMFFLHHEAAQATDTQQLKFLRKRAGEILPEYEKTRLELRQKIDSMLFSVQRHLDWASDPNRRNATAATGGTSDPLSYGKLKEIDFNCLDELSLPNFPNEQALKPVPFVGFAIDWRSIKHHLVVYNYCFRRIHEMMEPARMWGTVGNETTPPPPLPAATTLRKHLDNNIQRLNGLSMLGMIQVERVRELNMPPGLMFYVRQAVIGPS